MAGAPFQCDSPPLSVALSVQLHEYLGIPYETFAYYLNLFYAVYSLPNVFLTLVSGMLMDKFGVHRVLLLLSACVCFGQLVFTLGVEAKSLPVMLVGRIFFGIGGESVGVAQAINKELAFALGINLCVARLGSVVNAFLTPRLAVDFGVPVSVWAGFFFCMMSFIAGILLVFVIGTATEDVAVPAECASLVAGRTSADMDATVDDCSECRMDAVPALPAEAYEHAPLMCPHGKPTSVLPAATVATATLVDEIAAPSWRDLPASFYVLCLVCIFLYGTVVPFNAVASEFLQAKWFPGDPTTAGMVMSTPDSVSAVLVPIMGFLIDKYGRRCSSMIVCAVLIALAHAALAFLPATDMHPLAALLPLGVAYSLYGTAMWPSIACLVHDASLVGTAYGIATAALNASLTLVPVAVAAILISSSSSTAPADGEVPPPPLARYVAVETFFASLAVAGFIAALTLFVMDMRRGGFLETGGTVVIPLPPVIPTDEESIAAAFRLPISARTSIRSRHATATTTATTIGRSGTWTPLLFHPMLRSASQGALVAALAAQGAAGPVTPTAAATHARIASLRLRHASSVISLPTGGPRRPGGQRLARTLSAMPGSSSFRTWGSSRGVSRAATVVGSASASGAATPVVGRASVRGSHGVGGRRAPTAPVGGAGSGGGIPVRDVFAAAYWAGRAGDRGGEEKETGRGANAAGETPPQWWPADQGGPSGSSPDEQGEDGGGTADRR
ncbi:hypothetical protein AMAG_12633 [Allomyces macrogynus ATCC 38327]|uniref:Lysosomal dipeptide transporter MFSD1 n=1 Tax=Allomyces macrogynus (strain ATCC 38327) TaxID=578462 RepID=A0A0L0SZI2_ALLM3|nr:hypothetical protein AMAG_12633 [Allomyces macrogynus ATCC 38327]|eukprot:KNE67917.1 hypothetical protein AMAG_12633 [Allomyces macrogynus ATCC 38327]